MTDEEKRRQRRKNELGSLKPKCAMCGEEDITTLLKATKAERSFLEEHHISGSHEGETILVCRNCHAKLTETTELAGRSYCSRQNAGNACGRFSFWVSRFIRIPG